MAKSSKQLERRKAAAAGIDLGSRRSEVCLVDEAGEVVERRTLATTPAAFTKLFGGLPPLRATLEAGGQSNWAARLLAELGHEVIVADARQVRLIVETYSKSDRRDAALLAQITLRWPALLHPVRPRSLETQRGRALLRLRETLVEARTKLINAVRGVAKSFGERLPAATGEAFARQAAGQIPAQLREAAGPALLALEALTAQIQVYDRRVAKLGERYRATRRLRSIPGVGPLTSLAFVLALDDDPQRLSSSRAAGAFVGLRPKRRDSGESSPELSVTRNGDRLLRRLLVQCAQYILGPFGQDSALRRWGLGLAARSGTRRGKRRAVVATARKLAVLLHALWRRDEDFDPLRGLPAPS